MISSVLFSAVLALVSADLSGDLSSVADNANALASLVNNWSAGAGLSGALVIQQSYDPLSKAVQALHGDVSGLSASDVSGNSDGISGLTTSVISLLGALTSKASDFSSVGASTIVTGDINGLSQSSADIIASLSAAVGSDAPADLAKGANNLAAAFSSAIQAFGANAVSFPSFGASDDSSSESASASASGSHSASGSAAVTSAAGNGTTNGTVVVEQTVVETVCTHETCTGVAPANGAVRNVAFGGIAAIAAALL